jgi:hypothetical protein
MREKKSQEFNKKLSKIKLPDIEGYEDVVVRFEWEK